VKFLEEGVVAQADRAVVARSPETLPPMLWQPRHDVGTQRSRSWLTGADKIVEKSD
jgi:hypothetical protein